MMRPELAESEWLSMLHHRVTGPGLAVLEGFVEGRPVVLPR